MAYNVIGGFPSQQLSFHSKSKKWRQKCVDFGDNPSFLHHHATRKDVFSMKTNYDLLHGKLHMQDLKALVNPFGIEASFIPDNIQHYSTINSKLEVLHGEESKRLFDFRVIVTNPSAVSEIEEDKNMEVNARLQQLIADSSQSEDDFNRELEKLSDYFQYEYQDKREIRANRILNHYIKELELPALFNSGFEDAYTVGEEAYQCDIVGGEPVVEKINPMKMRVIRSGFSNKIEDADMIILEDYWSPGKIIEIFWAQLSKKDIDAIENAPDNRESTYTDSMDNLDARYGFVPNLTDDWTAGDSLLSPYSLFDEHIDSSLLPYDPNGNVRVLRVYWKSRRKIKKVKSYDPHTGEEQFNFYPETYIIDPDKGEEETTYWVNEAWEGIKIGKDIYVSMRPRPVQYNRLSNPSRCHFGIVGSIYTSNGDTPYSMVDIMKPYAYLYDVLHDRLNKLLARSHGKAAVLDFAKSPKGWSPDEWLYYLHTHGIYVIDSAKEGEGYLQGKPVGSLNNASSGVIDASLGNEIQQYISLLEWVSNRMGEIAGISKQREGQISNRETVGGVERATLQSAHSTEWLFLTHESVKKRVLECLLETTKIAMKGRKKKFEYILSDGSKELVEMDGDEFADCDYGLVVDNSNGSQELNQKLDMLAQAALQNQVLDFSTIMQLYTSTSLAEKQRQVGLAERRIKEQQQQQQQMQMQQQQQELQAKLQAEREKQQMEYQMHQEKLQTEILVAKINSQAEADRLVLMNHDNDEANTIEREKMAEERRQFDAKLQLDKKKQADDVRLKEKEIGVKKGK